METPRNKKRILVLDDEERMVPVIGEIAAYGDFDIHIMYNHTEITKRAKELKPDLIILDYLPVNKGCARVCRDIGRLQGLAETPVIVVAKHITRKIRQEAYDCEALFVTPLGMDVLAPRINYLMAS